MRRVRSSSAETRVAAWVDADQATLLRDALQAGAGRLVAVGSPSNAAAADFASSYGAERVDDVQREAARRDVDVLLLLSGQDLALADNRSAGAPQVMSLSPPASESGVGRHGGRVATAPLFRRSPGLEAASEAIECFGERTMVSVSFRCGPGEGSLGARLYDAMDTLLHLMGMCDEIFATQGASGRHDAETIAALRGEMSLTLRFPDSACAAATLSDRLPWFRGVTIAGPAGLLRLTDHSFEWMDSAGAVRDTFAANRLHSAGELLGKEMRRLRDGQLMPTSSSSASMILALCEAACLSSRTGQCEAPRRLQEILTHP